MEHELSPPDIDLDGDVDLVADAVSDAQAVPDAQAVRSAEHVGEGDDAVTAELDIDVSMLDTIEEELAAVERALALLDEGTYGKCEHCGHALDDDVLARAPTTRFCAEHLPLSLSSRSA